MIRSLLKLVLLLVVGILIYNYFLGTSEEKANSKAVFQKVKELGGEVGTLLKAEKTKYKEGKYDEALDKIGGILDNLKKNAKEFDEKYVDRISELDKQRQELERNLDSLKVHQPDESKPSAEKDQLNKNLESLLKDTQKLISEMETSQQ